MENSEKIEIEGVYLRRNDGKVAIDIDWGNGHITEVACEKLDDYNWAWSSPSLYTMKACRDNGKLPEFWTRKVPSEKT